MSIHQKPKKKIIIQLYCWLSYSILSVCRAMKFTSENKPTLRNLFGVENVWRPALVSLSCQEWFVIILRSHQVTIFRVWASLRSLSFTRTCTYTEAHTRPALGNQKQTVLNCKSCRLLQALVICSPVSCLLSAVRCVDIKQMELQENVNSHAQNSVTLSTTLQEWPSLRFQSSDVSKHTSI